MRVGFLSGGMPPGHVMIDAQISSVPRKHAATKFTPLTPLCVEYVHAPDARTLASLLGDAQVIAVIGFGAGTPAHDADPRYLHISLETHDAAAAFEVWRVAKAVMSFVHPALHGATAAGYTFAAIEVDEAAHGGIEEAARFAYRTLLTAQATSATPHVLRIWNYLDAINEGHGDAERYRRFCSGRAEGMAGGFSDGYPAATAIGVRDGRRMLKLYWLAANARGEALENPRQLSAWRYPRQYGPQAPSFARAMRAPTSSAQIYISGTAAIIGHTSLHHDDFPAQLDETLTNITSLLDGAHIKPEHHFGAHCRLKVYVRRGADLQVARARLTERLSAATPLLILQGDICRSELLIEIDGVQQA